MNETYIKIFSLLSRNFSAALLSSLTFGIIFAFFFMITTNRQEPDVYYFDFFEVILIYVFYSIPAYVLLAIPFSIFIDKYRKTASLSYYKKSILYSIAGIIAAIICYSFMGGSLLGDWKALLLFAVYGLISANLFLMFLGVIAKIRK